MAQIGNSDGSRLQTIVEALDASRLTVLVDRTLTPREIGEAFAYQGSRRPLGRIIISQRRGENRP